MLKVFFKYCCLFLLQAEIPDGRLIMPMSVFINDNHSLNVYQLNPLK